MVKKISIILTILFLTVMSFNCQKKTQIKGINLDISFSEEKLSDDLVTEMKLTWKTDAEFVKMSQDFNVYVHFWHDNNLLFQDQIYQSLYLYLSRFDHSHHR